MKKAIIFGYGGMGQRYHLALKKNKINVVGICDKKLTIKKNTIPFYKNYKTLLNIKADLACVVTNTASRFEIIKNLITNSKIKKIIIEKPIAVSMKEAQTILDLSIKYKKRILVNTHRTYSPNLINLKKFFKKKKEKITHIFINSPSAGIGNMGSTFFDISQYFLDEKPKSVFAQVDKSNTDNPRGKKFKDPGVYGVINYKSQAKVFFDLSENTGLPYKMTFKSKNYEVLFDELNNAMTLEERPKLMRSKPLYYYLFKPSKKNIKIYKKFNVVEMTRATIKEIFAKDFNYSNLKRALVVSEIITSCFISDRKNEIIKVPLSKKYYKYRCNFA
tara:strand:+ start:7278 stop:8273 length:996 start_codon:yes stop_codon:yes gene_type:complete